ncbi:hypothetical protein TI39_contig4245g00001 [Zymoseptoria brevis]|uniref:Uncharacterized protein n=1 Tax=Zymoseptoria brevis TaxID=1047168 RepID=A0A0F4GA15_9PEZI|nr:hypothetical protein TI39_contig4245g00001 [Zymoseptoria brevis]
MFEIERSEYLYDLIKENKTRMDRANELLEVIMDKFVASAILYFDKAYDPSDEDEDNAFMNTAFKKYLEAVLCACSAYHLQQDFRKIKQREFLSSRDPPFSKERRRVRETYDCSMKIELACRENYEEERTRFLEDYGRKDRHPGPRGLLTEQNMAINMVPETQRYPVSQRSFESNRDSQTGRPILPDNAYVAAPAQVSQDLQNLYDLRKTFRRAEADHRNGIDKLKNAKALRMGILENLPDEHFQEHFQANLGFTLEEHEARLRESMEAAREAYHQARRAIRQDLDQLPAVSESSFAARTSDCIENGSAPGSYKGRIQRSGDPALYNWQRAAASEISANGQRESPSEPSSLYNGPSLRFGERVSPSVRSDYTEARKYRARRKKWMRKKRASVTSRRS